ncbi:MAG: signal peptidase II [Desulfobacterales bacterium]|jgi:signal peptidase II
MLKNKYIRLAVIGGCVVIVDQITKLLILRHLPFNQNITVIAGFFDIVHINNPGGAFGLLASLSPQWRTIIFLFISSLAVGLIFYFYIKTPQSHPWLAAGFALIFGGAIGNLIDRLRFGFVIDFLDFYIAKYHWPAFNIADSAITVGLAIFVIHIVLRKMPD